MDIKNIVSQLEEKLGHTVDVSKVQGMLKGIDTSKFSPSEIVEKLKDKINVGDLDGDGKVESLADEVKGKAQQMMGGIGKMFGGKDK